MLHSSAVVHDKRLGQHFLVNTNILHAIVEKAGIKPSDTVLEIGPGSGNLTQLLLQQAKKVRAIEMDVRMVSELKKRFQYSDLRSRLELVSGDALAAEFNYFDICVANLPYQISSPFVFKLLQHRPMCSHAVIMFQKEFADRLVAKPGSKIFCRLSVNVQLMARVEHLMKVGRNNFKPPPKVQSAVVLIRPRNPPPQINYEQWDCLLRICFVRKNKTLGSIFKNKKLMAQLTKNELIGKKEEKGKGMEIDQDYEQKEEDEEQQQQEEEEAGGLQVEGEGEPGVGLRGRIQSMLEERNLSQCRPSKMGVEEYLMLLAEFNKIGIHFR